MKRSISLLTSLLTATLVVAACGIEHSAPAPSSTATPTWYVGTWTSTTSSGSSSNSCSDFEWRVTNQTATMISGVFFARCAGNLAASGSAWGELNAANPTTLPVRATAGATGPGVTACDVSLTGTATRYGDMIRIPYSGTTCVGPVSGTEVLQRH